MSPREAAGRPSRGCPYCRKDAPLVYRGILASCSACGRPRLPLSGPSVNLAGQGRQVGGVVARVLGWLVLAGGVTLGLMVLGVFLAFGAAVPGLLVSLPVLGLSSAIGYAMLRSGRDLKKTGEDEERRTKVQAILAYAANRGGAVTAWDVAQQLSMLPKHADALLTELAKTYPDHVAVDIDERTGTVLYRFDEEGRVRTRVEDARFRVEPPPPLAEPMPELDAYGEEPAPAARRAAR